MSSNMNTKPTYVPPKMEYPSRLTARNDVTGAAIQSKPQSEAYRDGWDRIFGKKKEETVDTDESNV